MTRPAIPYDAMLDGVSLASAPATEWTIRPRPDGTEIVALRTGGRRAFHRYNGPGRELKQQKYDFALGWEHLGALRETIEELLAVPGVHRLILWREETHAWAGTGSLVEFQMPRTLARDEEGLPAGVNLSLLLPRVKVGRTGDWLDFVSATAEDYAEADTADADEVLFLEGGDVFKLPSAPAAGVHVFARVVPVYLVLEGAPAEKRLPGPIQEPLTLNLGEA
jgi:hypothetical protein